MARMDFKQDRRTRRGEVPRAGRMPAPETLQPFRSFAAAMTTLARNGQARGLQVQP